MMAIHRVPFVSTTFIVQIHGLPAMFLHAGSAELVGNRAGRVHEDSISRKCVVAHRFLRFRIDIEVGRPILVGYFLGNKSDNESWVQFKYKRLGDFCYKCRMLDHITRRCSFGKPATRILVDGGSGRSMVAICCS